MAEAIAGLSLAANVAQFVIAGVSVARFLHDVYQSSSGLTKHHEQLLLVAKNFKEASGNISKQGNVAWDSDLARLMRECREVAKELSDDLESLKRRSSKSDRSQKVWMTVRAVWKRGRIEELSERLEKLTKPVALQLLRKAQLSSVENKSSLDDLSAAVKASRQDVSSRLEAASRELRELHVKLDASSQAAALETIQAMSVVAKSVADHCLWRRRIQDILHSLHFEQMAARQSAVKKAHAETFAWALDEKKTPLKGWLESGSGIFWVEGKPGSGKSTLMKYLERQPRTRSLLTSWAGDRPLVMATHYFWSSGVTIQRSLVGLFRTLLFHILMSQPEQVKEICPERLDENDYQHLQPWTLEQLQDCFDRLARSSRFHAKFCFFIDGLDEFRGEDYHYVDSPRELITFIKTVSNCANIKICASSRPWTEFQEAFSRLSSRLRVEDLTIDDIRIYVEGELAQSPRYLELQDSSPLEAAEFVTELRSHASGVFLWVYYAARSLLRGLTKQDDIAILKERLRSFPKELEEFFARMLESVDTVYRQEMGEILRILSTSSFPVTVSQLSMHRTLRGMGQLSPTSLRSMDPTNLNFSTHAKIAWEEVHRSMTRYSSKSEQHDEQYEEGNRLGEYLITARCGDLVHIWTPGDDTRDYNNDPLVGFLHRSVADFLALPHTSSIIDSWISKDFYPQEALALVYLGLRWGELKVPNGHVDRPSNQLARALYMATELGTISPELGRNGCLDAVIMISSLRPQLADFKRAVEGFFGYSRFEELESNVRDSSLVAEIIMFTSLGRFPPFVERAVQTLSWNATSGNWRRDVQSSGELSGINHAVLMMLLHECRVRILNNGEATRVEETSLDVEAWSAKERVGTLKVLLQDDTEAGLFMLFVTHQGTQAEGGAALHPKVAHMLRLMISLGAPRQVRIRNVKPPYEQPDAADGNNSFSANIALSCTTDPKRSKMGFNLNMPQLLGRFILPPPEGAKGGVEQWSDLYNLQSSSQSLAKIGLLDSWTSWLWKG